MLNNYICALDIGSTKTAAALASLKRNRIEKIFFETMPSRGIKEGSIIDSIDVVNLISSLMRNLKAKSGINVKFLYVNIPGQDIVAKHSHAVIPLAEKGNKVITVSDIERVNEQARVLGSSLEEEIIHLIPSGYSIDSKTNLTNPLGLYSHRLEVDLYLVCAKLPHIQSLARVINQSGYEIKELFFSGLATSMAVFNKELNEGTNLFCDIGANTTQLLVFRNGILKSIDVLPVGGEQLTSKLADALKIPFDLAEDIKRSYGMIADPEQVGKDKEILVKKNNLYSPIKQRLVLEVINGGAKLICSRIKDAVQDKVSAHEINNFLVAGQSVLLEGFIETLESTLGSAVKLGRISNPDILDAIKEDGSVSAQKYLTYLTPLGMVCEAMQDKKTGAEVIYKPTKNPLLRAVQRFKEVYQEYF